MPGQWQSMVLFCVKAQLSFDVNYPSCLKMQRMDLRPRHGSPKFRVWGGKPMIALILVFGIGNAVIHILSSVNLLPVYQ